MRSQVSINFLAGAAALVLCANVAQGDLPLTAQDKPAQLEGVGITEHLNQPIPLELTFNDESGNPVKLADFFKPGKPVILTLNYFRCPMLCDLTLNGMVNGLNDVEWSAGKEFEIVTVSFNPKEDSKLADVKKRAYLTQYKRESAKQGWHFLTGAQPSIDALCKAAGFGYRYDPQTGDYAHTATIMFLTPDGKLSRYMNNVLFEPRDLKFALMEASQGAIGSPMENLILLMCYHYDPLRNSYSISAMKIMRLGGIVTVVVLGAGLGFLWLRGAHAKPHDQEAPC